MKFKKMYENFMHELFGVHSNYFPNQILTETTLNRVARGHDEDGYAIISAEKSRRLDDNGEPLEGAQLAAANNAATKQLVNELKSLGYSYIPVYGGYKYMETGDTSYEKSFVVFPYNNVSKSSVDFDVFMNDILNLGGSDNFDQESVLIKAPNDAAKYYDPNTGEVVMTFSKNMKFNDVTQEYFTSLKKLKGDNASPQRFTYTEAYINPDPCSISERRLREHYGELVDPSVKKG